MKIITPQQFKNKDFEPKDFVREDIIDGIIARFNQAMADNSFHYISSEKKKYIYIGNTDHPFSKISTNEAVDRIKMAGWNVRYQSSSCAHGGFHALIVELDA